MAEWISVDKELPNESGYYLAWDGRVLDVYRYVRNSDMWVKWGMCRHGITHYMPLPEPPKGE